MSSLGVIIVFRYIIYIIAIAGIVLMIKRNKTRSLKSYTAYYAKKRREYPYLNDWLNNLEQKNINVAEIRSKESAGGSKWLPIIVAVAIVVLASMFFGNNIIVLIISVAIALLAIELIGSRSSKNPGDYSNGFEYGLSLECPSCHCPHSWKILRKEVRYLSYKMENNKFTEKGEKITTYDTKEWRDFKCSNCGHTNQTETTAEDVRIENKAEQKTAPDDYVRNYNPPMPAWNPKDVIKERNKEEQREQEIADYRERKQEEKAAKANRTTAEKLADFNDSIFNFFNEHGFLIFLIGNAIAAGMVILAIFIDQELLQPNGHNTAGLVTLVVLGVLVIMNFIAMKIGDMHDKLRIFFFVSLIIAILGFLSLSGTAGERFPGFIYGLFNSA